MYSLEFLNPDHAMMGWDPFLYWVFIAANFLIALRYFYLGYHHFALAPTSQYGSISLAHLQYGAFILACGNSHVAMGVHMLWTAFEYNVWSHAATAFASYWGVVHRPKPEPSS